MTTSPDIDDNLSEPCFDPLEMLLIVLMVPLVNFGVWSPAVHLDSLFGDVRWLRAVTCKVAYQAY